MDILGSVIILVGIFCAGWGAADLVAKLWKKWTH